MWGNHKNQTGGVCPRLSLTYNQIFKISLIPSLRIEQALENVIKNTEQAAKKVHAFWVGLKKIEESYWLFFLTQSSLYI